MGRTGRLPDAAPGVDPDYGGDAMARKLWLVLIGGLSLAGVAAGVGLLCRSQTSPFFPYFQSGLDALSWRQEVPEIFYPASWIPGMREIGTWPLQTWGSVHPRTGWTTQAEEPKAEKEEAPESAADISAGAKPVQACRSSVYGPS